MNTTEAKLDHANWIRNILTATRNKVTGITQGYETGHAQADPYRSVNCDHPRVQQFQKELEKLVADMRADLQAELDGLFK